MSSKKTVHIDWISFTAKLRSTLDTFEAVSVVRNSLEYKIGSELTTEIFDCEGWEIGLGRRPYKSSYMNKEAGINVWFGGQTTILYEFTGKGCKRLDEMNVTKQLLECVGGDMTRLDIAVDLIGDVQPIEIVNSMSNGRIKSGGYQRTESGDTYYLGSRKSDRFCRVYRYKDPHPRSDRTRVEYELKRSQARIAAAYIVAYDVGYVADSFTDVYKWKHEDMKKENEYVKALPTERADRTDSKTLHWLLKQCAPAFKRLVENGSISDPQAFFERHFLPHVDKPMQTTFMKGLDENE